MKRFEVYNVAAPGMESWKVWDCRGSRWLGAEFSSFIEASEWAARMNAKVSRTS